MSNKNLRGVERYASVIVIAALVAMIAGFIFFPKDSYPSYLIGFLFWIGLTLGCLPLLMLWLALFLATFQFSVPFVLLLFRVIKKSRKVLTGITVMQLVVQAVAIFWYTAPAYRHSVRLTWTDPVAFIGIGVAWIAVFGRQTRHNPEQEPILEQNAN